MKIKNKKTGEIVEATDFNIISEYNSLAELNEEWEDYEEPTGYWYIDFDGEVLGCAERFDEETEERRKEIGNYFETEEEAEKAVEKLKAWKRLKDKGLEFVGWCDSVSDNNPDMALFKLNEYAWGTDTCEDLDLLFGGEE